eukprot:scaffold243753_cov19-Tisochrysis_lutea.AAC.1
MLTLHGACRKVYVAEYFGHPRPGYLRAHAAAYLPGATLLPLLDRRCAGIERQMQVMEGEKQAKGGKCRQRKGSAGKGRKGAGGAQEGRGPLAFTKLSRMQLLARTSH